MTIPRIIHQTWKSEDVPDRYREWQASWTALNPDHSYRFWTDGQIEELVATRFPHLQALYSSYREPICRVDLGRYLILKTFGGIYADLDCECLQPIDDLLINAELLLGCEPDAHRQRKKPVERGLDQILCPSFIASAVDHPFWDHVIAALEAARDESDVLDATGPFLLTRAYRSFAARQRITLAGASLLYPLSYPDCESGRWFDIEYWERATRNAFMIHYWVGSWWRAETGTTPLPDHGPVRLIGSREQVGETKVEADALVSCIMVAGGGTDDAERAILCFLRQSYPHRELLIAVQGKSEAVEQMIDRIASPQVRLLRTRGAQQAAGAAAVGEAAGRYVCFWSETDLHDPQRIERQLRALVDLGVSASLLLSPLLWDPRDGEVAVSRPSLWEATLLCETSVFRQVLQSGPDAMGTLIRRLSATIPIAGIDLPRLAMLRVSEERRHDLARRWESRRTRYVGGRYDAVLRELSRRLPLQDHPARTASELPVAVDLFGQFGARIGLGAAVRGTYAALTASGVPATARNLSLSDDTESLPEPPPAGADPTAVTTINLVHTNPGFFAEALEQPGFATDRALLRERYTIGYWVWEAAGVPPRWKMMLPLVDELWVPSHFVAECVALEVPVPVVVMPHPVSPERPAHSRADLGLPDDCFIFLFAFDAASNVERKNPAGVIKAYIAAFPKGSADRLLVIKAKRLDASVLDRLQQLLPGRRDVRIVNEDWDAARMVSLIAGCDCYVSLHRSEGFGLTLAEAMYFGKPVIATGYSGNMDFTSPETGFLVPFRLTELERDEIQFPAGTRWAEPDLEAAAQLMRQVAGNRDAARAVGREAALWIRANLSLEAVGSRMKQRLLVLERSGRARRLNPAPGTARPRRTGIAGDKVLILTPVKDAEAYLPRYFELLEQLEYDRSKLSIGLLESDSRDRTMQLIEDWAAHAQGRYDRIAIARQDYGFRIKGPRWAPEVQRRRREILARSRNRLLAKALGDEDWVLWLDVDLVDYPADLLQRLLAARREIVVPHCISPNGQTFDLNTFIIDPRVAGIEDRKHLRDGLLQPPRGERRLYLDAFPSRDIVALDSVGGTALLIRADLHREGLIFPPFSYRGYIETEGLAMMAADMGVRCYGMPSLRITHSD